MNLSRNIISYLKVKKVNFFTGVPDSLLKNFCNELQKLSKKKHVISAKEGGAVSIAAAIIWQLKNTSSLSSEFRSWKYY